MAKTRKRSSGFTLIELIITIVISGILFATIGMIVVYSQQAWQKAAELSLAHDDFRYFKKRMEYQMHNATTYPFQINNGSSELRFITLGYDGGGNRKLVINRIWLDNNTVKYENWYATTIGWFPPHNEPNISGWETAAPPNMGTVLIQDAQSLQFAYGPGSHYTVETVVSQNPQTNLATGATTVETSSFTVTNRNIKN